MIELAVSTLIILSYLLVWVIGYRMGVYKVVSMLEDVLSDLADNYSDHLNNVDDKD